MTRTKNMTSGNPVKLILVFALPILAGNTLQQLYSLVDSLIIGRLLGVTALTAVSASGWLDWAVLSIPMGLAQGYSIHAAQCYGGKRFADLKRSVAQSYLISAAATVFLEISSQFLLHPVLVWMNSPDETIRMTEHYLRIIYAGLPVVMCVNIFSGFLHALGNSRIPLIALACSTAVNIVLDWWFVGSLGMGTNGGACATVLAQVVSAVICFMAVLRIPELKPAKTDHNYEEGILDLIREFEFEDQCVLASLDIKTVHRVQALDDEIDTVYIMSLAFGEIGGTEDVNAFSIRKSSISSRIVKSVHENHKEIYAWTVNDETRAEDMIADGVDSIITDDVPKVKGYIYDSRSSAWYGQFVRTLLGRQ